MRRSRRAALAAAVVCLSFGGGCTPSTEPLRLAVSVEEPAPSVADALGPLLADAGFRVTVEPDEDPANILEGLRSGDLDLAIIEEPPSVRPGVMTIAPLYPSVLHVLVDKDIPESGITEIIAGRNIYTGPRRGSAERFLRVLASDLDLAEDTYRVLDDPWTIRPDVFFIFGGLLSPESLRQLEGYRLLSFGAVETLGRGSQAEGIVLRYPNLRPFILPRQTYPGLTDEPVLTLAVRSILIAGTGLDEQTAYTVASQLFTHAQDVGAVYPLATSELDPGVDATSFTLPLHPGARRYIERDQPGFIERFAEVLALAATLAIALISSLYALLKHRRQRKKDRVDVYYASMLELRARAGQSTDAAELTKLQRTVLDLQQEVFGLVIDERIAADESLSVFLALSNQVLNEIAQRLPAPAIGPTHGQSPIGRP